jgi:hypothetical protein
MNHDGNSSLTQELRLSLICEIPSRGPSRGKLPGDLHNTPPTEYLSFFTNNVHPKIGLPFLYQSLLKDQLCAIYVLERTYCLISPHSIVFLNINFSDFIIYIQCDQYPF